MKTFEIIHHEQRRADAFHALSTLFTFPSPSFHTNEKFFTSFFSVLEDMKHPASKHAMEMWKHLQIMKYEEFAVEYTRLFIGPFQTVAPPYGSFYLDGGKLMGNSTIIVINAYVKAGLEINTQFKDLPDHIAAEMEFLYYLLYNEMNFLREENFEAALELNAYAEDFLTELFLSWVRSFTGRFRNQTDLPYFHVLAACLNEFTENCLFDLSVVWQAQE